MDVGQYLEIFLDESREHLQALSDQLMILEQEPDNEDTINEIFRAAHSLKGMAGTMGYKRMQRLTHDMENVFSEVRTGNLKVGSNLVDVLFQALDALEEYVGNIQETTNEGENDNEPIIMELNNILEDRAGADKAAEKAAGAPASAAPAAGSANAASQWKQVELADHEKHVIAEAIEKGMHVFGLSVTIQETCILKAARAFLVFKALEELGDVIISNPSTQDIEDEKFENEFTVFFVTDADMDKVLSAVRSVSEIEDVQGEEISIDSMVAASATQEREQQEAEEKEEQESAAEPAEEEKKELQPAGGVPEAQRQDVAKGGQGKGGKQKQAPAKPVVNRTVRVDIEKLDVLMNLVSELIIAKNALVSASSSGEKGMDQGVNEQIEYLESVTTSLHESVMKVRMVPIESVVNKFPRMIRDLSKSLNKKMQLFMTGEDTELDRTVVDEIGDPLMHLLRNAADHGLESNAVRVQRGKPEVGTIRLDAYQDGNNVVIEVKDDGDGIDVDAVRNKAIERGTITTDQAATMNDKEIIDLLFLPSFSTAKKVTDVSGRGVGLDVVKSKIEALGGDVSVKTKLGLGSTWSIRLPLTLAIIQALMVEIGGEKYAVSLGSIQTIEDIAPNEIKYVQTEEVINLREVVIPIIRLNQILGIESKKEPEDNLIVVIVKKGDKLAGLVVDELIGQQEIVIKSLGKYLNLSKLISGATILGDGEVALILDANALI